MRSTCILPRSPFKEEAITTLLNTLNYGYYKHLFIKISFLHWRNIFTLDFFSYLDCFQKILTERTGYIASPNHPSLYTANELCFWVVIAPSGIHISFEFEEFDIEEALNHQCSDFIQVIDGADLDVVVSYLKK